MSVNTSEKNFGTMCPKKMVAALHWHCFWIEAILSPGMQPCICVLYLSLNFFLNWLYTLECTQFWPRKFLVFRLFWVLLMTVFRKKSIKQKQKIPNSNCVSLGVRSTGLEYAVLNLATLIMNALLSPEFYAVLIPEALAIYIKWVISLPLKVLWTDQG